MRAPRWEVRLADVLSAAERRPFAWWHHDCASFAARAVEAVRGVCPLAGMTWPAEARGALRVLRGERGLAGFWAARLGPSHSPLTAQRGDVVLVRQGRRLASGVVTLDGWQVAAPGRAGLVRVPLSDAVMAWSV
jgi:hypothetical protein